MSARQLVFAASGADTSLDLNFLTGTLDPRITFTRASVATYFDVAGVLQTAGTNVARFDFDPVTHAPRGLLIEEARTNYVTNGNAPGPAAGGATVVASNDLAALFSPATIYKHTITSGANRGAVSVTGLIAATNYQFSLYAYVPSANTTTSANMLYNNAGEGGTGTQTGSVLPSLPSYQYDMSKKGQWQRLVMGYTTGAAETSASFVLRGLLTGDVFYTALYDTQAGTFPTSYIPTTTVAVTRAADVATMPTGSWFNQTAGTLQYDVGGLGSTSSPVTLGGFGSNNGFADCFYIALNANAIGVTSTITAGGGGATGYSAIAPLTPFRFATSWTAIQIAQCLSGGPVLSVVSTMSAVAMVRLAIGQASWANGNTISGPVRRVRYWPRALSGPELQQATS